MEEPENTAHLIDAEPILFLGCSSSEILGLAALGFAVGLVFGLFVALLSGIGLLVLPFLILFPVVFIYRGGKRLGKAKEGKPSGYYDRLLATQLAQFGFGEGYINRTGHWRIRR
jgi:conjugative transfer region protein (TIGR03750 family)